jgi:hypothetical protein
MKRSMPWLAAGGLALAGCTNPGDAPEASPLTAQAAALTANEVIATHLDDLARALKAMEGSRLMDRALPASEGESCPGGPDVSPPDGQEPPLPCEPRPPESALDATDEANELKKWLAERVFNPANAEPNGPGADAQHVVFRLKPELMCDKVRDEAGVETPNADCVKTLTDVPVRLTASSPAAGDLDLAVSVGTTRPVDLQLHRDAVRVSLSLAEGKAALQALAGPTNGDVGYLPETIAGRLSVVVTRLAAQDYQLALSVKEAVTVAQKPATDPEHYALSLATRDDVLKARITGGTKSMLAGLDLGVFDATAALDLLAPRADTVSCPPATEEGQEPPPCTTTPAEKRTGTMALHLGGLSVNVDMNAAADTLKLTGLGLGDESSWVKYGTAQVLTVDVNANAGRRFDLEVKDSEAGAAVTFDPKLAVRLAYDLATLVPQMGEDEIPEWMRNGTLDVSFDGDKPSFREVKQAETEPFMPECDDQGNCTEPPPAPPSKHLAMTSGTLTIAASGQAPVVVTAPQCLVEVRETEGQSHDHPVQEFGAGACE